MDLSVEEAAHVLGVLRWRAEQILGVADSYDLDVVEQAATVHWRFRDHVEDPYSYWLTTPQAAEIFGFSSKRVQQLVTAEKIPYLTHQGVRGIRMLRRGQVEVIANARESRRLAHRHGG